MSLKIVLCTMHILAYTYMHGIPCRGDKNGIHYMSNKMLYNFLPGSIIESVKHSSSTLL